ncbi:5'/3'-nucleotidase SurE [Salinibius halmophilus]|uniref:5'/3'-nucleotidase SurE n=1 Tax=Salinibius halmophilus TaxID=1853216 RepID=UPI001F166C37|nr:5'/3'-nucleotidase SurE [Salinibius halmophilus]
MQNILLTNDDGIQAQGINRLFDRLSRSYRVKMIAPEDDCSGKSQSLTLDRPIKVRQIDGHRFAVQGTPADCIQLGSAHLIDAKPDVVISGINHGANLGDDVLYSGTLGAAREGRHIAKLCMAVSLAGNHHFDTAVQVVCEILQRLERAAMPSVRLLNINVPDIPYEQLQGFKVCRLGERPIAEPAQPVQDPKGQTHWWLGRLAPGQGEDFEAIKNGYVAITPIKLDETDSAALAVVDSWIIK